MFPRTTECVDDVEGSVGLGDFFEWFRPGDGCWFRGCRAGFLATTTTTTAGFVIALVGGCSCRAYTASGRLLSTTGSAAIAPIVSLCWDCLRGVRDPYGRSGRPYGFMFRAIIEVISLSLQVVR